MFLKSNHHYLKYSKTWESPGHPEVVSLNKILNKLISVAQAFSMTDNVFFVSFVHLLQKDFFVPA